MNDKKQRLREGIRHSIDIEFPDTDIYILDDQVAGRIKSLTSIKFDLQDAHKTFTELSLMVKMQSGRELYQTAFWKAAIITYARCFADAEDVGTSKLNPNDCFNETPQFIHRHKELIGVRNGYIAHRGNNEFEETVVFAKVNRNNTQDITFAIKSLRVGISSFKSLMEYLTMIEHLLTYTEMKIEKQFSKLGPFLKNKILHAAMKQE